MSGWDDQPVYAVDQMLRHDGGGEGGEGDDARTVSTATRDRFQRTEVRSKLRQFLRTFREDEAFVYRQQLLAQYEQGTYFIEVDTGDVEKFDPELLELLRVQPAEVLPVFEEAARDVVMLSLVPQPDPKTMPAIQVQLTNFQRYTEVRDLQATDVARLVCVRGIVISSGCTLLKATRMMLMCRNCKGTRAISVRSGFGGARLPRTCDAGNTEEDGGAAKCPLDPYQILPDSTSYVDQQRLKLQEAPENVPTGEMPRHISISVGRHMAGTVKPGTRVSVVGIYDIFQGKQKGRGSRDTGSAVAIRFPYLQAVGLRSENEAADVLGGKFRPEDEEEMHEIARQDDVYERLANSIAPAIYGSADIKKAVACMLFGGSRKMLPDGMRLRGDVNVLLLGDPSTAKSQFLKFAVQCAPIGVYTSGKGSSAAGLTASVIRDPSTGEFQLEGGALVLADKGICCIDEFDKMDARDRVAIHEAMEQQTISIAKAGITTILNSRTAVLAAANPVFGRYDDMKSPTENIEFQSTILSRFDLVFIVRDLRNDRRDQELARYVIGVHKRGDRAARDHEVQGEFEVDTLKRYVAYARAKCFPRLSAEAAELLKSHYVDVRRTVKARERELGGQAIPITVRQLEAIVRLSEALARMELSQVANEDHVREAIRLFTVSTYSAATSSFGGEAMGPEFMERVKKVESHLRRRIPINATVPVARIVRELTQANYDESVVVKAIEVMVQRDEMRQEAQRKLLHRIR